MDSPDQSLKPRGGKKIYATRDEAYAAHLETCKRYRERKRAESGKPPKGRGPTRVYDTPEQAHAAHLARQRELRLARRIAQLHDHVEGHSAQFDAYHATYAHRSLAKAENVTAARPQPL